jgi:hypothetical protein
MSASIYPAPLSGIQETITDAKGDIIAATAADAVARLAVGANDTVLTADSSTATGIKWAAPAGGGKVLQVVQVTYSTSTTIASTSFTDTGLSASITPSSASSKILVQYVQSYKLSRSGNQLGVAQRLLRGASTEIYNTAGSGYTFFLNNDPIELWNQMQGLYLDSPATTSSTTYKTQCKLQTTDNSATYTAQSNDATSSIILMEIGV